MATTKDNDEKVATKAPPKDGKSGEGKSLDEQASGDNSGQYVGKVTGRNIDSSYHDYAFTDAYTGEPVPVRQVVHDVAVGVNEDGSLDMKPADEALFANPEGATKSLKETTTPGEGLPQTGANVDDGKSNQPPDTAQSRGANQGESGERGEKR